MTEINKMEMRKKILIAVILQMLLGITRYNKLNLQLIVASINLVNLVLLRNKLQLLHRVNRSVWCYPQPQHWFNEMLNNRAVVSPWKRHFRFENITFYFICDLVRYDMEKQQTRFRRTLSVEERVGCALWRLATGDSYQSCGLQFGIGKSTANAITKAFIKAIRKRKNEFIKFPVDTDDVNRKILEFQCLSKFPNVVGAIDGCHIEIFAPTLNAADYFNRNRYYSVVLQGISDANQKFIHMFPVFLESYMTAAF